MLSSCSELGGIHQKLPKKSPGSIAGQSSASAPRPHPSSSKLARAGRFSAKPKIAVKVLDLYFPKGSAKIGKVFAVLKEPSFRLGPLGPPLLLLAFTLLSITG